MDFETEHDVVITASHWSLSLNLDHTFEELVFSVDIEPEHWLAIAIDGDFMDKADVIYWESGATGYNPKDSPSDLI